MILSAKNLTIAYQHKIVIKDLTLSLPEKKISALIGANGSGKSTLLKSFAHLLKPKSGNILLNGENINSFSNKVIAKTISYLPQQQVIPEGLTVQEFVGLGRNPYVNMWGTLNKHDNTIVKDAMRVTNILEYENEYVTNLSGGQQQRVALAMNLAQDTNFLLFDEPTTYLDLNFQLDLMKIIHKEKQQGKTILMVLHDINQAARYCDHLIILKNGQIVAQGLPKEIMQEDILANAFSLQGIISSDPISKSPMFIAK